MVNRVMNELVYTYQCVVSARDCRDVHLPRSQISQPISSDIIDQNVPRYEKKDPKTENFQKKKKTLIVFIFLLKTWVVGTR